MKIHCISCGHGFDLDDDSYSRYRGPVRCWVCQAMLNVQIVEGCVESVSLAGSDLPAAPLEAAPAIVPRRGPGPRAAKPEAGTKGEEVRHG